MSNVVSSFDLCLNDTPIEPEENGVFVAEYTGDLDGTSFTVQMQLPEWHKFMDALKDPYLHGLLLSSRAELEKLLERDSSLLLQTRGPGLKPTFEGAGIVGQEGVIEYSVNGTEYSHVYSTLGASEGRYIRKQDPFSVRSTFTRGMRNALRHSISQVDA